MSIKSKVLGVRIDQATEKRLERFESVTKVEAVTLARAALDAALDYFDENGGIRFPLVIQPIPPPARRKQTNCITGYRGAQA